MLEELWTGLCADTHGAADGAAALSEPIARALAVLREIGVPLEPIAAPDLIEPVPDEVRALGRAMDLALSGLHLRPMSVDLEHRLAQSERQLRRRVADFNLRYGFNAEGWRDSVNRRRLMVGAAFMTAPRASTVGVAKALGYSSPTAFCRALDQAGLPSPGDMAWAIAALR